MTATPTPTPPVEAVDLAAMHPAAANLATQLADVAEPSLRRERAERAVADRRNELALYRDVYLERYGRGPTLERVYASDRLLTDLIILTIA